jgi:hypothetical protein
MKLLITGGSGSLAKYLEVYLKKCGHQVIIASSKNKISDRFFDLNQDYDSTLLDGVAAVVHCSNNPNYVFNSIEERFLLESISRDIKLVYIGSTSSYLVSKNKYGLYKQTVESFTEKIGGLVLTCGLIYGKNFIGQISRLETGLKRLPFRIFLSGSKSVFLTDVISIATTIDTILNTNKLVQGRILVLDSDLLSFNDLLDKLGGYKKFKLILSAKFIAVALNFLPFTSNHFSKDRFKGILSDFESGLFSNSRKAV